MKSRCDKAPAREGSAAGSAAAPPGPAALRNAPCHRYTPGEEQSGLRDRPRRGWSGLTPGKGTRHLPSRAARPPAPLTPAGPLPQRTAPLAPSCLTGEHPSPRAGFSGRRSPAAPHGQAPQARQHRPRAPDRTLAHPARAGSHRPAAASAALCLAYISRTRGRDTRVSHTHRSHVHGSLTPMDFTDTDPRDT